MSIVQPGASADVPEIPDGLYQATIKAVKDITLEQADSFGNLEKVEIQVAFTDSDGVSQTLEPRLNRKWGEKANLFLVATACGIEDLKPYEGFDTDLLVGKKVNVLIETTEEGRWPRVKTWSRIRSGKPMPGQPGSEHYIAELQKLADAISGPALVTPMGDIDWLKWWAEAERVGATKLSVAKLLECDDVPALSARLGDMSLTEVVDLLEIIKGATA